MSKWTFDDVSVRAERSGKCAVCGKRWKRSKVFRHTVNPWNKTDDGKVKTREQVRSDVIAEANAWQPEHCDGSSKGGAE